MTNATVQPCPHCGASNPFDSAFCEACGKAVPQGTQQTPRIVSGTPSSDIQKIGQPLPKQPIPSALYALAALQSIGCAFWFVYGFALGGGWKAILDPLFVWVFVLMCLFWFAYVVALGYSPRLAVLLCFVGYIGAPFYVAQILDRPLFESLTVVKGFGIGLLNLIIIPGLYTLVQHSLKSHPEK